MKRACPSVPFEAEEQSALFDWVDLWKFMIPELTYLYHIPNETAYKLKNQGVLDGVSDLHLPVACRGYIGLWIELKRIRGGRLSDPQDKWLQGMANLGHFTAVCKGAEEAKKVLLFYLDVPDPR